MVTLTNAENALKSVYLGAVTELINTKTNPLLSKIEQTSRDVWGKEIRKAASYGLNGGIGAGDEDGTLPMARGTNYLQFVTTLKNLYGQIEISDKAIRASADGKGAFTDLLNNELQGLLDASKFNLGRMLYGDGSGKLTSMAVPENGSIQVESPQNLMEGMVVDMYTIVGDKLGTTVITSIDRQTNRIKLENPHASLTAGCELYIQGSKGKEITGLGALFKTKGTLYGVDRDAHPCMKPYLKTGVGALDEIVMQQAIDSVEMTAGSTIDFIAVSASVKYAFQEYMAQYKRNIDIMELAGGFKSLSYNGIPLVHDRFVPEGVMYLLDTRAFKLHQLCDWQYLETENGKILRQTQGKPTYTATLVKYCDLICDRPNGQACLKGIVRA